MPNLEQRILTMLTTVSDTPLGKKPLVFKKQFKICIETMRNRLFLHVSICLHCYKRILFICCVWNCFPRCIPLGLPVRRTKPILKIELWEGWGKLPLFMGCSLLCYDVFFFWTIELGLTSTKSSIFTDHPIISMLMW